MAQATRSKAPELIEPQWYIDSEWQPCKECEELTKWVVVRSGRYCYNSRLHFCKACWPPSVGVSTDQSGTRTSHFYGWREATAKLIATKK